MRTLKNVLIRMALPAVLLVAVGSGCTDASVQLNVKRDGSGTIDLRVLLAADARRRMRETAEVVQKLGLSEHTPLGALAALVMRYPDQDPADAFARPEVLAEIGRSFGRDLQLVKAQRLSRGAERGFAAVYAFKGVGQLRWPCVQGPDLGRSGALCFAFVPGPAPVLKVFVEPVAQRRGKGGGGLWSSGPMSWIGGVTGWYRTLEDLFKGMRLSLAVTCDGKIRRTNAQYVQDASTVRLAAIRAADLDGAALQALVLVDRYSELADFRARAPAGVQIEDTSRVLVIQFQ